MMQPVPGAAQSIFSDPKVCTVKASAMSNATKQIQDAIDDCGDRVDGGIVLVTETLLTASLWMRSNLTLRIEGALLGTATGWGNGTNVSDAPLVYTRRNSLMVWAHAGLINGGRCVRFKSPLVGWDDCEEWTKLENVVLEGGGELDGRAEGWYLDRSLLRDRNQRPMMLDLLWIRGLTVKDLRITGAGYWTIHPTFCDNVRIENNSVLTTGDNTDGCDPDSSWNVYVANNTFSTGDDCVALKAGRDWSGLMVNVSTRNVLVERNIFEQGHGISIGSETSGWIYNVTIKDSVCNGTDHAVRIKSTRGRGGGAKDIEYRNISGSVKAAIQLTLRYDNETEPSNETATPALFNVTVAELDLEVTTTSTKNSSSSHSSGSSNNNLECLGLSDSRISNIAFESVRITAFPNHLDAADCEFCSGTADDATHPMPCFADNHLP